MKDNTALTLKRTTYTPPTEKSSNRPKNRMKTSLVVCELDENAERFDLHGLDLVELKKSSKVKLK